MAKEPLLRRYSGPLDLPKLVAGMATVGGNAARLCSDAETLLSHGSVPSAAALAVLAIEESGKLNILRRMAVEPAEDRAKSWKEFRNHRAKNAHWALLELVAAGATQLEHLRPAVEGGAHTEVLDTVKQIALYADCLGTHGNWSDPTENIDQRLGAQLVAGAKALVPRREVTLREMELWVQHVGPHYASRTMGAAVIAWAAAMHAEGLGDDPREMERFMGDFGKVPLH